MPFNNVLQLYYWNKPFYTALHTNESSFHIAIETLWLDQLSCISELTLVVDASKKEFQGRDGRLDILFISATYPASAAIEVKNFTVSGLWRAETNQTRTPSWYEIKKLQKELKEEMQEELLRRGYR